MSSKLCASAFAAIACTALTAQGVPFALDALPLHDGAPWLLAMRFDAAGGCVPRAPQPLDAYRDLAPIHRDMLLRLLRRPRTAPSARGCWLTPPSPAAVALFEAAMQGAGDFQPTARWTSTIGSGPGLQQGDPTVLTYSFVPDGTFVPSGLGEPAGPSTLFASMATVFGSTATWQNVVHAAFDRWSDLTGLTFVHEPNDDGAALLSGGLAGVRGELRIAMKFIDGANNTLAYNYFPNQGGDMVLDAADLGYFATTYRQFFNLLTHEQGHGIGIEHVCPQDGTKVMEPLINTFFTGPQFDDILTGQRLYGDPREPNDSYVQATDLGTLPNGVTDVTNVSIDGVGDVDILRFAVVTPKLATISVIPVGTPYLEGPQIGQCTTGALFDPSALRDLNVFLLDGTGTQLLALSATAPAGQTETIPNLAIAGGSYAIRVAATGVDTIQPYRLEVTIVDNGSIATVAQVGSGCGGLQWTPLTTPVLGQSVVHSLSNIPNPSQSIGLVLVGSASAPGGIDLGPLGAPGCRVYQQTDVIVSVFPLLGSQLTWILPIPTDPGLVGSSLWTQGTLAVPPGTNPLGVLTANAAELVVGTQ